ncbi:hypothetical protein [Actinacidiphila yanglinensis]|nr:hypothetical protein [Actinacidiphila yanglinensis]
MDPEIPSSHDPHVRHLRVLFLAVVTGSFLFLIPWIGYLSVSLPTHHEVDQWRFAWVGFDGALIAAIGVTAWCAWRRLQIFIPWALVTAALLCCDAWFDIVLDWNSDELTGAILTAVFAELPLAALLVYVARKMIRLTVIIAWRRAGRTGTVPALSRLTLVKLTAEEQRRSVCECGHDHPRGIEAGRPEREPGHAVGIEGTDAGTDAGTAAPSAEMRAADASEVGPRADGAQVAGGSEVAPRVDGTPGAGGADVDAGSAGTASAGSPEPGGTRDSAPPGRPG